LQLSARNKSCKNFLPRYALLPQDIISCMNNFARSQLLARYKSCNIFNEILQEIMTRKSLIEQDIISCKKKIARFTIFSRF
jgi:hypothetical protein